MTRFYGFYGALVLLTLTWAAYEGYAFSSLFEDHHHGGRGSGGVWVHSYHK